MVARINQGEVVRGAIEYNEEKVTNGRARILYAQNYLKSAAELSFFEKLGTMEKYSSLNDTFETRCLHISLNFHPSEKLSQEKQIRIVKDYMEGLGFKDQPFLCYEHLDAAHPHLHIVTTPIQLNSEPIKLNMIAKRVSEPVRKMLEEKYDLVRASGKAIKQAYEIPPVNIEKVIYGKKETKRAITNVVNEVLRSYKFTSLTEMNEILRQFNVYADEGAENSRIRKYGGLVYRILGADGKPIGNGIKASSIFNKPTRSKLELKYPAKKKERKEKLHKTRAIIDRVLSSPKTSSRKVLVEELAKLGIKAVFRVNEEGRTYALTFVDNVNRLAVKGSDLGKDYSANAIVKYLVDKGSQHQQQTQIQQRPSVTSGEADKESAKLSPKSYADPSENKKSESSLLADAMNEVLKYQEPEHQADPYKKKKKKKKKGLYL